MAALAALARIWACSHADYGAAPKLADYPERHPIKTMRELVAEMMPALPALSGPNRYRIELRGSFTQKILSDFNISVSPYYSYDSRTPVAGIENEDWGWISSVGWIF